jgi:hypothetical protein
MSGQYVLRGGSCATPAGSSPGCGARSALTEPTVTSARVSGPHCSVDDERADRSEAHAQAEQVRRLQSPRLKDLFVDKSDGCRGAVVASILAHMAKRTARAPPPAAA